MLNEQKPEKSTWDLEQLDVVEVFPTLQGEGPHAGKRAVFVRLAGCNLQCPGCDTNYTRGRRYRSPQEVLEMIEAVSPPFSEERRELVVITGGEPFRQALSPLLFLLLRRGFHVQIETNGTLDPNRDPGFITCFEFGGVDVVCSPKSERVAEWMHHFAFFKYVLSHDAIDPTDGLPLGSLGYSHRVARPLRNRIIYVQPMDCRDVSLNHLNMLAARDSALKHGYILCLQLHKLCDLS